VRAVALPAKAAPLAVALLAGLLSGCGDDSGDEALDSSDRGAGVDALGGSARTDTLARASLERRPAGPLAWIAHEIRLEPGEAIEHEHEQAFAYGRSGEHSVREAGGAAAPDSGGGGAPDSGGGGAPDSGGGLSLAEGEAAALAAGTRHVHSAGGDGAVLWEIRLARPGAAPPAGAGSSRRVFESEPLEGVPAPAAVSLIEVTVPPRGGRTTVHTHPGPEFIYQLSGVIDYQNAIAGTKRLGPGGAEGIPPGTAVQKRNTYADPAVFLSLFLVDPSRPFAPKADF
jgi:quercetin dioxygenase-like cupin family protein